MEMTVYETTDEVNSLKINEFKEEDLSTQQQEEIIEFAKEGNYACLAAPQVGHSSRFFLLNGKFYFNPFVESIDENGKSTFEVCENFPDKRIDSMRYKWIEISYQEGGEPQTKKFELEDAQYVQFCMDWLDNSIGSLIETIKQETVMNSDELIGRNDPCPCKSGKKYKKCCGKR